MDKGRCLSPRSSSEAKNKSVTGQKTGNMNSQIHLQQAMPNNQAADRYRNRFQRYSKLDKHDKEGPGDLSNSRESSSRKTFSTFPDSPQPR
ncbi:hypothetical protein CEP54_016016 [Fusarium duplospermum]|uniref:Uncharacterized protein n=1 Tax=Fusarium duplospermum TaxID=1325734 RepID=A0A428NJC3_9HYPO|nr:hypothetical protein CEP54_016016 [Fusarium duplospermum]